MGTTMTLAEFYQYVRDSHKRIADIYREIEEIQYQFNDLYAQQLEERRKLIATYAPRLSSEASQDVPMELRQLLETQKQVERQAIQEEMARLESEIADKRQRADNLIKEAQHQVANLREQNPILDRQEEDLKARRASIENDIAQLNAEIRRRSGLPFGWLIHVFTRRRLHRERERLAENLQAVNRGITTVRDTWQAEKQRLQTAQTDLQSQWQTLSVEIAQLQARLDYLSGHIDEQSLGNAAQSLLDNLTEVPISEGPWEEHLNPLVELKRQKAEYEAGLRSVSEILGLLKGLGEGMDRFIRSVGTVYEEQHRYKLPSLTLNLSDAVTSFHATWPDFQAKVKDEKYLGTHPLEFDRRIKDIVRERLAEAAIQKMFEDMGEALTRATQAWR